MGGDHPRSDGNYHPDATATRAEFAETLYQLLVRTGTTPAVGSVRFSDVPSSRTDAIAIYSLAAAGITNGVTDTTFEPDRAVTRGQMASLMIRANENTFCQTLPSVTSFPDAVGTSHEANIR